MAKMKIFEIARSIQAKNKEIKSGESGKAFKRKRL